MSDVEKQVPGETAKLTDETKIKHECYTKEQLMELSNTPCWNTTRRVLLAIFWVAWIAAVAWSIVIVIKSPKCLEEPELVWFTKGAIGSIETTEGDHKAMIESVEAGTFVAFLVSGVIPPMVQLIENQAPNELKELMLSLQKAASNKGARILYSVDVSGNELTAERFEEFFKGYLALSSDGYVFLNADQAVLDAVREKSPDVDIFYDVSDIDAFMKNRTSNEYLYRVLNGDDIFAKSKEIIEQTSEISNYTIVSNVPTLWDAKDQGEFPNSDTVLCSVLPGGFVIPSKKKEFRKLIELRQEYHSLRVIENENIWFDTVSVTRKFDLRPAISGKIADETDDVVFNSKTSNIQIYEE